MAKYKVSGEIESDGPPALQLGLKAERISSLPLDFGTAYSGRRIEVKSSDAYEPGVHISIHNAPNTHLNKEECRRLGEALLEAAGEQIPTAKPSVVTDNDGDEWTIRANGTYTRVMVDGRDSPYDEDRTLEYIRETYGIRSER